MQCFSTFLDLPHPSLVLKQFWRHPKQQFTCKNSKVKKLAALLELSKAPKGSAATPVENHCWINELLDILQRSTLLFSSISVESIMKENEAFY